VKLLVPYRINTTGKRDRESAGEARMGRRGQAPALQRAQPNLLEFAGPAAPGGSSSQEKFLVEDGPPRGRAPQNGGGKCQTARIPRKMKFCAAGKSLFGSFSLQTVTTLAFAQQKPSGVRPRRGEKERPPVEGPGGGQKLNGQRGVPLAVQDWRIE